MGWVLVGQYDRGVGYSWASGWSSIIATVLFGNMAWETFSRKFPSTAGTMTYILRYDKETTRRLGYIHEIP